MPAETPPESAAATHATVLELLQLLNRAEERPEGGGLARNELEREMEQFWTIASGESDLISDLEMLVTNGLVRVDILDSRPARLESSPGGRYRITNEGRSFLLNQQRESGEVEYHSRDGS